MKAQNYNSKCSQISTNASQHEQQFQSSIDEKKEYNIQSKLQSVIYVLQSQIQTIPELEEKVRLLTIQNLNSQNQLKKLSHSYQNHLVNEEMNDLDIHQLKSHIYILQDDLKREKNTNSMLDDELTNLSKQIIELEQKNVGLLESKIIISREKDEILVELQQLIEQNIELKQENQSLLTDLNEWKDEKSEFLQQTKSYQINLQNVQDQVIKYQQDYEQLKHVYLQAGEREQQQIQNINTLQQEKISLEVCKNDLQKILNDYKSIQQSLQSKLIHNQQVFETIFQQQKEEISNLNIEIKHKEQFINRKQQEINILQSKNKQNQEEILSLQKQIIYDKQSVEQQISHHQLQTQILYENKYQDMLQQLANLNRQQQIK